jgi:hypothetical protein
MRRKGGKAARKRRRTVHTARCPHSLDDHHVGSDLRVCPSSPRDGGPSRPLLRSRVAADPRVCPFPATTPAGAGRARGLRRIQRRCAEPTPIPSLFSPLRGLTRGRLARVLQGPERRYAGPTPISQPLSPSQRGKRSPSPAHGGNHGRCIPRHSRAGWHETSPLSFRRRGKGEPFAHGGTSGGGVLATIARYLPRSAPPPRQGQAPCLLSSEIAALILENGSTRRSAPTRGDVSGRGRPP